VVELVALEPAVFGEAAVVVVQELLEVQENLAVTVETV
jgi:hypothetical protein